MGGNLKRMDRDGTHQAQFNKNKRKIYKTQNVCGICGLPVDMTLRYPDPMSKSIDHIIPIIKGGHPSDIDNLQLAHLTCNNKKRDGLPGEGKGAPTPGERQRAKENTNEVISNRILPHSVKWTDYKG